MSIYFFLQAIKIDNDGNFEALTKIHLQEWKQNRNKIKEDMLRSIIAKVGFYMGRGGKKGSH